MADNITLTAESRTEFGKGAARRLRRDWKVPAVLYGHGTDPVHMALPSIEFARVLRAHGTNAVLTITVDGSEHLALVKTVVVHPLRNYIEHADLLVIRRGEKVTIDVTVVIVGDAEPGSLVTQDATTVQVEADVMSIPEQFEVSVEGAEIGTQILASEVALPSGVTLISEPETLIVNVVQAPSEQAMEAEVDAEGAGVVEDEPETAAGEAGTDESSDSE
ncbi:MAG: 50S ribosomal protein L25/general stress protein Ctc [Actinomycetota bacterium]|nr:50S ribosomal protein L25/general stress protein Ctc [Actinomycetota bacterium]